MWPRRPSPPTLGLPIEPKPFVPLLQGALVTEHHIRWLGGDAEPPPSSLRTKFFGRELSRLLDDVPVRPG